MRADYEDGQARGVKGSPHYFVANDDFFCPALELGRDAEDHLTARFDPAGVGQFLASVSLWLYSARRLMRPSAQPNSASQVRRNLWNR